MHLCPAPSIPCLQALADALQESHEAHSYSVGTLMDVCNTKGQWKVGMVVNMISDKYGEDWVQVSYVGSPCAG